MVVNTGHLNLERRSGVDYRDRLRSRLDILDLTFSGIIGDPRTADKVQLVMPDEPANLKTALANLSRNPNWPTARQLGSELSEMEFDQRAGDVVLLPYDDLTDAPFSMIQAANDQIAERVSYTMYQNLANAFVSGTQSANITRMGNSSNYINDSGNLVGTASRDYIVNMFIAARKWAIVKGLSNRTGRTPRKLYCICPGSVWATWLDYIEHEKPSDALVNAFIGPGSAGIDQGNGPMGFEVRLANEFPQFTAPASDSVTADRNKKFHQVLFTSNRAMVFSGKPTLMSTVPANRSTTGAIGTTYGRYARWLRHVLNPEQLRLFRIRAQA